MTTRINPRLINPSGSEGGVASISSSNVGFTALNIDTTSAAPINGQALIWDATTTKYKPSGIIEFGLYSSSVSNVAAYAVTTTMANAVVFPNTAGFTYVVDSILISNQESSGLSNVAVSSNIVLAS